ncbi:PLDc N-terminal domain-containing protein [Carboxylicivirga linearis]|uniref:PLDc N-terminal domain-containing protein n=1 Tax=Carboxylicivirga linearis TaxID=1628157 RepID=A0ABS5JV18_9BACT|nr:PLDc N-terminal domain-containing protein [Carboxylicivirga linearis]MBS2098755.1 PLDc N-terminal domain-containing protein [Carboxylicivirga linearis]
MFLFIGGPEWIIILAIFLFVLLLPLIALINILNHEFTGNNKIIWVLIVLFLPFLGSVLYFAMGKNQKITN